MPSLFHSSIRNLPTALWEPPLTCVDPESMSLDAQHREAMRSKLYGPMRLSKPKNLIGKEALESAIDFVDEKIPPRKSLFQQDYCEKPIDLESSGNLRNQVKKLSIETHFSIHDGYTKNTTNNISTAKRDFVTQNIKDEDKAVSKKELLKKIQRYPTIFRDENEETIAKKSIYGNNYKGSPSEQPHEAMFTRSSRHQSHIFTPKDTNPERYLTVTKAHLQPKLEGLVEHKKATYEPSTVLDIPGGEVQDMKSVHMKEYLLNDNLNRRILTVDKSDYLPVLKATSVALGSENASYQTSNSSAFVPHSCKSHVKKMTFNQPPAVLFSEEDGINKEKIREDGNQVQREDDERNRVHHISHHIKCRDQKTTVNLERRCDKVVSFGKSVTQDEFSSPSAKKDPSGYLKQRPSVIPKYSSIHLGDDGFQGQSEAKQAYSQLSVQRKAPQDHAKLLLRRHSINFKLGTDMAHWNTTQKEMFQGKQAKAPRPYPLDYSYETTLNNISSIQFQEPQTLKSLAQESFQPWTPERARMKGVRPNITSSTSDLLSHFQQPKKNVLLSVAQLSYVQPELMLDQSERYFSKHGIKELKSVESFESY